MTVQRWPYWSPGLLGTRRQPGVDRRTRTCMRLGMRLPALCSGPRSTQTDATALLDFKKARLMSDDGQVGRHDAAITTIKAVHTLAWFSIESCMVYLLYAGFAGRTDRRAAIAAVVVAGESLIFAANGFRCPLTELAEHLGADRGSVTDIYLPGWFAHNLPAIHTPLLFLAAFLHGRNIRRAGTCAS
jgi:hypothetical protein